MSETAAFGGAGGDSQVILAASLLLPESQTLIKPQVRTPETFFFVILMVTTGIFHKIVLRIFIYLAPKFSIGV